MEAAPELSGKEKVIYQYTLLKKIRHSRPLPLLHASTLAVWLAAAVYGHGGVSVVPVALITYIAWHLAYRCIMAALRWRTRSISREKRYAWTFRNWPWFGYLPSAGVPFRSYCTHRFHALALGLLLSAWLAPWLPPWIAASVTFMHLWCLAPELIVIARMARHASPGSILTYHQGEVTLHDP